MTGKNLNQRIAFVLLKFAAFATVFILVIIISYILINGFKYVSLDFLTQKSYRMGREGGIFPFIITTVYATVVSIAIAAPIGVGASIYLTEYSREGRIIELIRFCTETLAGIPSIIYGLFGFVFFVIFMGLGWSILSGGLTLACMVLPTIVRTSEEAIKTVPVSYREGSLALGATRWQTIVKVVLPSSIPGIITGIILSIGRAIGETAAVILTVGSSLSIPASVMQPGRTMAVHLYILTMEGLSNEKAFATATVLIFFVVIINYAANRMVGLIRR
ncbi:MAG: Phosphate transport system permease protein PstA [Firmicutes bacterium]|nr:Phosphate transport system permease protein PstA [Bacillota bacterium]MDI6706543.1 phosphate ABC transporter permease PstA [Bacillota bacterium]